MFSSSFISFIIVVSHKSWKWKKNWKMKSLLLHSSCFLFIFSLIIMKEWRKNEMLNNCIICDVLGSLLGCVSNWWHTIPSYHIAAHTSIIHDTWVCLITPSTVFCCHHNSSIQWVLGWASGRVAGGRSAEARKHISFLFWKI